MELGSIVLGILMKDFTDLTPNEDRYNSSATPT
jgi:hypothetical protein